MSIRCRGSFFVRIDHPERNGFLRAPLAKGAGGTGACGKQVFVGPDDPDDPDYQKLLGLFEPLQETLIRRPRMTWSRSSYKSHRNSPECPQAAVIID